MGEHTDSISSQLRVAIIGGGISGLAIACSLRRYPQFAGGITVYELRSKDWNETAAALGLQTNGSLIMEQLGLTRKDVVGVIGNGYRTYNLKEEQVSKARVPVRPDGETGFWFSHRQDLKDALMRKASGEGEGKGVRMVYDAKITEIDAERGLMKFEGRGEEEVDLIIGADGIWSKVREAIIPASHPKPASTGLIVYRFLMPMKNLRDANGKMPNMFTFDDGNFVVIIAAGDEGNRSMVVYPCRDLDVMNFVCAVPDTSELAQKHLKSPGTQEEILRDMQKDFEGFPEWLLKVFERGHDLIELFPVMDQAPLPSYVKGRTVVIGDAAHVMAPYQAQATNQSLEDVEGLDAILQNATHRDEIPNLLKIWDEVRRPHATVVQKDSLVCQNNIAKDTCSDAFLGFKPYVPMRQMLLRRAAKLEGLHE